MTEDEDREQKSKGVPDEKQSDHADSDGFDEGLTSEIENRQPRQIDEREVEVVGVYEPQEQETPSAYSPPAFILLRDRQDRQVLIWIGRFEAYAIYVSLENVSFDRPMTHDLLKNTLERLGGKVERILIDDIWEDTYYAKISVSTDGKIIDLDCRPSDAIALALRTKAPIYMAESVLEQASVNEEK